MAAWQYDNFDLLIETEDDGEFRARVIDSPTGESPTGLFRIPFEPTELENLLLRLDPGRSGTRRVAADPQSEAALKLGSGLFEAVFTSDIRLTWARSLDVVRAAKQGLRLRLRLAEAPSLAVLPWELLYDRRQNSYIAQSERTPVVRYLEVPMTPRALDIDGALRILVVVSSPTDLPELDVEAEWRRVEDALAIRTSQGTVHLDRLEEPTLSALSKWLRTHDVHVLHFIGHGEYDTQLHDGVLYFCDRYGRRAPVSSTVLGPYLRDHDPLRLVFLNACQSARVDSSDPFSGMAQGLVQQDCVALVAMQFPISDGAATEFTGDFYGSLADGLAVDQAVTSGRKALLAGYASEWATPVLFLRDPSGKVFDHIVSMAPEAVSSTDGRDDAGAVSPERLDAAAVVAAGAAAAGGAANPTVVPEGAAATPSAVPVSEMPLTDPIGADPGTEHPSVTSETRAPEAAQPSTPREAAADTTEVLAALRVPAVEERPTASEQQAEMAAEPTETRPLLASADPAFAAGSGESTAPPAPNRIATDPAPPPNRLVGRLVAAAVVLALLGWVGWWVAHRPTEDTGNDTPVVTTSSTAEATTTAAPTVVSHQVTVAGNQSWTDAGVACEPGKSVQLAATGTVYHDPTNGVGPEGATNPDLRQFNLPGLSDANHSGLVASLDKKAPFTVVGSSATYDCAAAGELYLGPNDGGVDNNHGEWTVTVTPSG
jgi:CHAT domain-containing protein